VVTDRQTEGSREAFGDRRDPRSFELALAGNATGTSMAAVSATTSAIRHL